VPILAIAALAVALGTAFVIWIMARQFSRRYAEVHRRIPPPTWMFRTQTDPLLEEPRRRALALLPILVIAAVVYVVNA
jgi:hypothetical protein